MGKVESIYPANDFKVVAKNASSEIDVGIIVGYDTDGNLCVFGGGMIDGNQPSAKDWLWMIESFKANLMDGIYTPSDT